MISANFITEWAAEHPWRLNEQVEQDLLISRSLVAIYSDPFLKERLAFRGGTALHKLQFFPQVRYSEDIDLVQISSASFGEIFDHLKKALDLFDMHYAISNAAVDKEAVLRCFRRYMLFSVGYVPTVNQFDENMAVKLSMPEFLDDTVNYLRNGVEFDPVGSWAMLRSELIDGGLESQAV